MVAHGIALFVLCGLVALVEGNNSSLLLLAAEKNVCLEEALRGTYDALGFSVVDIVCEEMDQECVQLATSFDSKTFISYEMKSTCDKDEVRRVFRGINQRRDTAIIISTRKACIRPILQLINEIDEDLDQHGFFMYTYKWTIVTDKMDTMSIETFSGRIIHLSFAVCPFQQSQSPLLRSVIWSNHRKEIVDLNWPPRNLNELFPAKKFGLNAIQLTVAVKAWPPFVLEDMVNGKSTYRGMAIEILDHIAEALNFTYRTTTPADKLWGNENPDGSWTGLVGQLLRKEADMVCAALSGTYARSRVMSFTLLPYFVEYMAFLYKKPDPRATLLGNFLGPLKPNVWICVISAMVLVALVVRVTGKPEGRQLFGSTIDALWFSFGTLLQRGSTDTPKMAPTRVVHISWCLFSLALVAVYSANLTASLASTHLITPLKTFQDLAEQTDYKMGFIGGGAKLWLFTTSTTEPYMTIGRRIMEAYKQDKTLLSRDYLLHIERAQKGGYVFISDVSNLKPNESCEIAMQTSNEQFQDPLNFGIRQNSALTPLVDRIMMLMIETGLLRRIQARYYEQRNETACDQFTNPGSVRMDLEAVTGVMFLFMASLCGATVVLIVEVIYKNNKKELKDKMAKD